MTRKAFQKALHRSKLENRIMNKPLVLLVLLSFNFSVVFSQQKSYSCRYFSIKYPQSWTTEVVGNPNSTGMALTEATINIKPIDTKIGEPKYNIAINMDPSIDWSTIGPKELGQFKSLITSQYSGVSFMTSPKFVSYKGLEGIYMEYTAILAGYEARMMQCIIHKKSGFTYFITLCVDYNKAESQLEVINDIMDTMVIK